MQTTPGNMDEVVLANVPRNRIDAKHRLPHYPIDTSPVPCFGALAELGQSTPPVDMEDGHGTAIPLACASNAWFSVP
ncbi:hypothetical protein MHUMG1_09725 [Metarhizium humberi]|uniref:Uncharacterized protein n=1 Tax=Metarhizium humberi TaxID=2596975 RepID=A0A9P8S313_9HYPO|nr:hypothetical protein MHUMG1_09725 [Metarhizium humberi]